MSAEGSNGGEERWQEICALLAGYNPQGRPLDRDTDLSADLNIDSVAAMGLVMEVEDKYDISIPLNLLSEVRTVGDLARVVNEIVGRG